VADGSRGARERADESDLDRLLGRSRRRKGEDSCRSHEKLVHSQILRENRGRPCEPNTVERGRRSLGLLKGSTQATQAASILMDRFWCKQPSLLRLFRFLFGLLPCQTGRGYSRSDLTAVRPIAPHEWPHARADRQDALARAERQQPRGLRRLWA